MMSISAQSSVNGNLGCSPFLSRKPSTSSSISSSFFNLKASSLHSSINLRLKTETIKRIQRLPATAELAPAETVEEIVEPQIAEQPQKLGVVVKSVAKPRLVLKFIWMEKNIGLALDQVIPGHGTVPLSPYFFWPRKDAWEELKTTLESKPWISQKKMIILLNQATDIINLWQQSGGNLS